MILQFIVILILCAEPFIGIYKRPLYWLWMSFGIDRMFVRLITAPFITYYILGPVPMKFVFLIGLGYAMCTHLIPRSEIKGDLCV